MVTTSSDLGEPVPDHLICRQRWVSYPVLSCLILSYPVISCHILSDHSLSYPVLFCPILSCLILFYHILTCPVLPCPVRSCPILSYLLGPPGLGHMLQVLLLDDQQAVLLVGCAVPIAIPLNTCLESRLIISPLILFAISIAKVVLPLAVEPTIVSTFFNGLFCKIIRFL